MANPRWAVVFPLLLLLPVASGLLVLDSGPAGTGGVARIHVEAEPGQTRTVIVLTHEDPLAGTVADRIVPVDLGNSSAVDVTVTGLRADVELRVGSIADASLPRAGDLTGLLNLSAVRILDDLSLHDLPKLDAPLGTYAYEYGRDGPPVTGAFNRPSVQVLPTGLVALAYSRYEYPDGFAFLRVSRDGGHRFGPPMNLTLDGVQSAEFRAADYGSVSVQRMVDGTLGYLTTQEGPDGALSGWTVATLDPLGHLSVGPVRPMPAGALVTNYRHALLPNGTALVASWTADSGSGGPSIHALYPRGQVAKVHTLTWGDGTSEHDVLFETGPSGAVFLGWKPRLANDGNLTFVQSADGGASWSAPANATFPRPIWPGSGVTQISLDVMGTTHLATTDDTSTFLYYARFPLGLLPTIATVGGELEAPDPILAIRGASVVAASPRIWLFANVGIDGGPAGMVPRMLAWESYDGGLHFQTPHEFSVDQLGKFVFVGRPGVFPDGRPLLVGDAGPLRVAIPLFDPFPEPGCASTYAASGAPPSPRSGPPTCPESFSYAGTPGDVEVQASVVRHPTSGSTGGFPTIPIDERSGAVATGAVVAVAALALEPVRYGLFLMAALLFARLRGPAVLGHAIRQGIYDHVRANPGIRFGDLRRDLGLSHGSAAYHLQVLERNRLLQSRNVWTRRRLYPAEGRLTLEPAASDVFVEIVARRPGLRLAELSQELRLSRQLAQYHLRRLEAAGRIVVRREGSQVSYWTPRDLGGR